MFHFIIILLKSYLKFPERDIFAPNPEIVLKALNKYLKIPKDIDSLKLTLDIVRDRLKRRISTSKIRSKELILDLISKLKESVEASIAKLVQQRNKNITEILKLSSEIFNEIQIYESIVGNLVITPKNNHDSDTSDEVDEALEWTQLPTIKWLTDGSLYECNGLKKSYDSTEDYVETIRKLWTMLTFYWGTAAIWPKCTCNPQPKGADSRPCNTPLLTKSNHQLTCTQKILRMDNIPERCGKPAKWTCIKRGHDAICSSCLTKKRTKLMGPPGRDASTDIYDGVIENIQINGDVHTLHISQFMSRKPPTIPVNWSTSYRLQSSMLVGIISLDAIGLELKDSMKIRWGEIVTKDRNTKFNQESQRRRDGQLSIRLLSHSDCSDIDTSFDSNFRKNSHIAIIDLQVFVPEVITVLSTLGQQSFLDGFCGLSFQQYLLDPEFDNQTSLTTRFSLDSNITDKITYAIYHSSIDCVSTLTEAQKLKIITQISNLGPVKTLDATQSEAFVNALIHPLHCTQGPPGTGKVYFLSLIITYQLIN